MKMRVFACRSMFLIGGISRIANLVARGFIIEV